MPSKLKSETARANGAKSKGPKTTETRDKSSRNSLKHGLTTRHNMLLACEDPALFQQVVDEYTSVYQPTNPVERDSGLDSSRSFLQQEESVVRKGILVSA